MRPPSLIAWDFDGVLNRNIRDGRFIWADDLQADLGLCPEAMTDYIFRSGRFKTVLTGRLDILEVAGDWLAETGSAVTAEALLAYWFEKDSHLDPGLIDLIARAPGRSVIATNNEARRADYIMDAMGLAEWVERMFAAGPMGVAKPDPAFFQAICDWAQVPPGDALLIDDHGPNVDAAAALGWRTVLYSDESRADLPAALGL